MRRVFVLLVLLLGSVRVVVAAPEAESEEAALAGLRTAVADPDRGVRYAAVQALGKAGAEPEWLAPLLRDAQWCVRQEAAFWLRRLGTPALAVLDRAIGERDPATRSSAVWALSGHGAAAVPLLHKALSDTDTSVRVEALASIRRLGVEAGAPLAPDLLTRMTSEIAEERAEAALTLLVLDPARVDEVFPAILGAGVDRVLDVLAAHRATETIDALASHAEFAPAIAKRHSRDETPRPAPSADELPVGTPGTFVTSPGPGPGDVARLERAARDGSVMQRIQAALDLGVAKADAMTLAVAIEDPERDVRAAAAKALGAATGDAEPALVRLLKDSSWRVRLAAIESLGLRRVRAVDVAPFLADANVAISDAAARAMRAMAASAAVPVAEQLRRGSYSVVEYAPAIFDAAGSDGAAAVATLVPLLSHADVNVRETAARALRGIGVSTADASKALVAALADDRLCVVAQVSLALGRLGLSDELLGTLTNPRARVRAYGAFAIGWALGARKAVDQVPFEVRLPVLDLGLPGPFPTAEELDAFSKKATSEQQAGRGTPELAVLAQLRLRALRSKDPTAALAAALALDYEDLDAADSERVMEVLLPEGFREGAGIDLDRVRETIGSSELPACLAYMSLVRRTDPALSSIFGNFHRTSRADSLPGIYWFQRNADPEVSVEDGELRMPASRTIEPLRERAKLALGSDPGSDRGDILRALLRANLEDTRDGLDTATLWLLNDWTPKTPEDARLAIRAAQLEIAPAVTKGGTTYIIEGARYQRLAGIRALGRLHDLASEQVLRRLVDEGEHEDVLGARGSLARRGDPDSIAWLSEESRDDADAWVHLLEAAPRHAAELLAKRLVRARTPAEVESLVSSDWSVVATMWGVRVPPDAFAGVEAVVASRVDSPAVLAAIATHVPTCRTKRVATKIFELLEEATPSAELFGADGDFDEDLANATASFLFSADSTRAIRWLRQEASREADHERAWAYGALLRAGDRDHAKEIFQEIRKREWKAPDLEDIEHFGGPEALAYLRDVAADPTEGEGALAALARIAGWPRREPFDLGHFPEAARGPIRAAILRGDIEVAKRAYSSPERLQDPLGRRKPVWRRLALAALAGDMRSRGDLWSGLRAGRLRWIHTTFEDDLQTLGHDPSVLPHWLADLDSNCCRVSDGLELGAFEQPYRTPDVYGTEANGLGQPPSQHLLTWFTLEGGRYVANPLRRGDYRDPKFVPEPE